MHDHVLNEFQLGSTYTSQWCSRLRHACWPGQASVTNGRRQQQAAWTYSTIILLNVQLSAAIQYPTTMHVYISPYDWQAHETLLPATHGYYSATYSSNIIILLTCTQCVHASLTNACAPGLINWLRHDCRCATLTAWLRSAGFIL
jgi:hypothetical protein